MYSYKCSALIATDENCRKTFLITACGSDLQSFCAVLMTNTNTTNSYIVTSPTCHPFPVNNQCKQHKSKLNTKSCHQKQKNLIGLQFENGFQRLENVRISKSSGSIRVKFTYRYGQRHNIDNNSRSQWPHLLSVHDIQQLMNTVKNNSKIFEGKLQTLTMLICTNSKKLLCYY